MAKRHSKIIFQVVMRWIFIFALLVIIGLDNEGQAEQISEETSVARGPEIGPRQTRKSKRKTTVIPDDKMSGEDIHPTDRVQTKNRPSTKLVRLKNPEAPPAITQRTVAHRRGCGGARGAPGASGGRRPGGQGGNGGGCNGCSGRPGGKGGRPGGKGASSGGNGGNGGASGGNGGTGGNGGSAGSPGAPGAPGKTREGSPFSFK
ncbi:H/ACA ribonucleoprotein complex subunit GAR1 [Scaptodrosophila lebanonensis]|uniref:H/ACA ribonucleoprotein complex subunit GAR1 n=1 Tax=Drosophila lebanonensis TaxID=7225 RepID=A0A6J2TBE9_DROLE|nr:H/ACA ribonucleoprotein complex subunit GAR1 [Scaptodrosophila lebanonensis]